jgi:pimeloyl-ACP methyl ester carboxylesterase
MKKALIICAVLYVLVFAGLIIFQRHFIYVPFVSCLQGPPVLAAGYQPVTVTTEDGLTLTGWHHPARDGKPTILWLHGNADSLAVAATMAQPFAAAGYGIMAVGYRGYNCQPGKPSEQGLYADARAFMRALLADGLRAQDVVIFGHSLGSGVAVQMATEFRARGLILMGPFLSVASMGQVRFPMFPTYWVVRDRFDSAAKIAGIGMPLLLAHGDADFIIPFAQGQQLFQLAHEPKEFMAIPGGSHVDQFERGFDAVMRRWLQERG